MASSPGPSACRYSVLSVSAPFTHGPVLNRASMVIYAAINGQGVALARTTLAAWDLICPQKRLRACRRP
jgi:hypothetical protein